MGSKGEEFDPDEISGIQIRYTHESEDQDESENEEEFTELNPKVNGNKVIEQFVLIADDPPEDSVNTRCGLCAFSPDWLQVFASKKAFMLVFSLLAVVQGMSWAYFTATITTLEKRFKISSQTAGIVMTGNELSQVLFSIIIAYYGSHGHRPRWIAVGVIFSALACLLLASPHFFYGAGQDALSLTKEYEASDGKVAELVRHTRSATLDDFDDFEDLARDELFASDELSISTSYASDSYTKLDLERAGKLEVQNQEHLATGQEGISETTEAVLNLRQDSGHGMIADGDGTSNTTSMEKRAETQKSSKRNMVRLCERSSKPTAENLECKDGGESIVPLILIFLSQFVSGIGVLLFFSLGGPYLDDNIKKTQSPMLFGVTMSLRLIGPTLGFVFGSICLKIYISPTLTPIITPADPRWMGAWWLGWVVLGGLMTVTSFSIALFPRELPKAVERRVKTRNEKTQQNEIVYNQERRNSELLTVPEKTSNMLGSQVFFTSEMVIDNPIPKLSEMSKAVKSLLKNKINLYNNLSAVFYIFSAIGYWTYMPKYMETIFMQTAANAALVSGFVSIAFQAAGLLISGALISKFQPSARKLAAWNVFLGFLYVIVKIGFTQMGCNPGQIAHGVNADDADNSWNLTMPCNQDCNCKVNKMLPVCFNETNTVYYSACHAGCEFFANGTASNCSCLPNVTTDTVKLGTCSDGCFKSFVIFLAVNAVIKLLDSSGRIGNMLVSYRCVDPKDKSLAIGLAIFLISIFAMLPAPIVFGAIIDSVCLVWGTKCGAKGNCWLYDGERLRYVFNLTAAAFTFLGAAFDCLVWYYVKELDLYDEEKNVALAKAKKTNADAAATGRN